MFTVTYEGVGNLPLRFSFLAKVMPCILEPGHETPGSKAGMEVALIAGMIYQQLYRHGWLGHQKDERLQKISVVYGLSTSADAECEIEITWHMRDTSSNVSSEPHDWSQGVSILVCLSSKWNPLPEMHITRRSHR